MQFDAPFPQDKLAKRIIEKGSGQLFWSEIRNIQHSTPSPFHQQWTTLLVIKILPILAKITIGLCSTVCIALQP
jgi:hypothetical protein